MTEFGDYRLGKIRSGATKKPTGKLLQLSEESLPEWEPEEEGLTLFFADEDRPDVDDVGFNPTAVFVPTRRQTHFCSARKAQVKSTPVNACDRQLSPEPTESTRQMPPKLDLDGT